MGSGIDIRVHAQAHAGRPAFRGGDLRQHFELGDAFDVEAHHVGSERLAHLGARLADAGEDDLRRIAAGGDHALEFAAGDDVEAASGAGEGLQHREIRVRLERIADQRIAPFERALIAGERGEHRGARVHIQRRSEAQGQIVERAVLDEELPAAVGNVRGAWKRHRGADADGAALGATAALAADPGCAADAGAGNGSGNFSGPFWPQPPARPTEISARPILAEVRQRAALLGSDLDMPDLSGPWRGPAPCFISCASA